MASSFLPVEDKLIARLEDLGVKVVQVKGKREVSEIWETFAGYTQQKRDIEDTILLPLRRPEVYDEIARGTRCNFETNRPRAVLFEGPPGTGKTSCARVIANQAGVPLLSVPLEVIMLKYFGESENKLGKVFTLANEFPNGAIIFLDEVDSLATSRDSETHEATRRILSVILRQIDGFEQDKKVVVIAATNRKQDLDPALLSRFDSMITFGLPDQQTRQEIVPQYAKHLTKTELAELAVATEGMSGRDIRYVCLQAERRWASKIIRDQAHKDAEGLSLPPLPPLPPLKEYIDSAKERQQVLLASATQKTDDNSSPKKPRLVYRHNGMHVEGPMENFRPSSSRSFTGTVRLLSGEPVPAPAAPEQPQNVIHNIVFWRNGFTVNDGPLRRLDDPENAPFLESIRKSECPRELEPADRRCSVHVNLIRRDENCPEPVVATQVAFQDVGRTLGRNTDDAAPEANAAPNTAPTSTPSAGQVLDSTLPFQIFEPSLLYQLQTVGFPPK